jgi:hypothetical protein
MVVHESTKSFLKYLQAHPEIRDQIHAGRDRTLLYSGDFFRPMWQEINARIDPGLANKQIVTDVLERVAAPGSGYANMLAKIPDSARHRMSRLSWSTFNATAFTYASILA